jgi:hypothetical protein
MDGQTGVCALHIHEGTVIPTSLIFILIKRKCETSETDSAFQKG